MKESKKGNVNKLTKLSGVGLRLQGEGMRLSVLENAVEFVVQVWTTSFFLVIKVYKKINKILN